MALSLVQAQPANGAEARLLNRLLLLMSKTNEPMAMGDALGNLLDVNQAMCLLMNASREQLLRMRVPDFIVAGEETALRNRSLRKETGTVDGEIDVRRPDGSEFHARFWDVEVQLEGGGARNFIGLSTDATALDSQETNAILRTHFDDSPDGKLIVDANGRTIYANLNHRVIWGLEDVDLQVPFAQRRQNTYLRMSDPSPFKEMFRAIEEDPKSYFECTVHLVTGQSMEVRSVPIVAKSGTLLGRSFSTRDITTEQQREMELRESETRYRSLVSSLPVGVVMHFTDNRIGATNEAAERILGMTRDELLGLSAFDPRWHPIWEDGSPMAPDEHPSVITMTTGEPCKDVVVGLNHVQGAVRWMLVNSVALRDAQGAITGTVISFQDITEQRHAQAALLQTRTAEAFNALASGVAHKVNNSLTTIVGNAYIAGLPENVPAETIESLAEVMAAATDATALVRDLLALSGGARTVPQPVDISKGVQQAVGQLAFNEAERISLALDYSLPSAVFDARALEQVTTIFLRNALEAGTKVTLSTRLEFRTHNRPALTCSTNPAATGHYVAVEVRDDGPGLDPEIVARIFQPFVSTKFAGRGLGLAAAAGIAGSYHSVIEMESSPAGCLARLLIPIR